MFNMGIWVITCASCGVSWKRLRPVSEFEQLALESHPCPACGAYTLSCRGPKPPERPVRMGHSRDERLAA